MTTYSSMLWFSRPGMGTQILGYYPSDFLWNGPGVSKVRSGYGWSGFSFTDSTKDLLKKRTAWKSWRDSIPKSAVTISLVCSKITAPYQLDILRPHQLFSITSCQSKSFPTSISIYIHIQCIYMHKIKSKSDEMSCIYTQIRTHGHIRTRANQVDRVTDSASDKAFICA